MLEADRPGHPLQGDLQRPLLLRLPRAGAAFPVLPPKPPSTLRDPVQLVPGPSPVSYFAQYITEL